jgi:hypothetical protein
VIIQNRDGSIAEEPGNKRLVRQGTRHYYAEVPHHLLDEESSLIDRIIGLAFDALGARRLEVRVYEADETCA